MIIKTREKPSDLQYHPASFNSHEYLMKFNKKRVGGLYAFTYGDTRLKIGFTTNINSRLRDHSTLAPDLKMVYFLETDNKCLESALIGYLSAKLVRVGKSEVFNISGCKEPLAALISDFISISESSYDVPKVRGFK